MSDEIKHLAPDTPADTLHAHVEHHIQLPEHEQADNIDLMKEVTSHPNLSAHSIDKLYHHTMAPVTPDSTSAATGDAEPRNDLMENILKHPNTPKELKQDFVLKTFNPENPSSDLHAEMADSGILDENQLKGMAEKVLASGDVPHAYKHLGPNYYMKFFKGRSQQDPNELDENGQKQHSRELDFAKKGLINSSRHTPETLDRTIDAFAASKHDPHEALNDLVEGREDLSKDQLNKIHQWYEANKSGDRHDYYANQRLDALLSHKNVDPALLAKYAVGKNSRDSAIENPRLPQESINGMIKRFKDSGDWETRNKVDSLLQNPSLTKPQVKALIQKGFNKAIKHPMADEADVRDYWQKGSKDLDSARDILQAQSVPPDVLKEIVNHKNQEVAVKALNHPNADMDVVDEGLKRRAKTVQDAARLHPLVAEQQVKEGLKSGATSLSNVYHDPKFQQQFDKLPKMDQEAIFAKAHEKYQGDNIDEISKKTKERPENVISSKFNLALDQRVPSAIREANSKDLANIFDDKVPKNQMVVSHSNDVMGRNQRDNNSRIVTAISHLAVNGDKNAQAAILKNPGYLSEVQSNINLNDADPDFLADMFRKRQEYIANNTQVYDHGGRPELFDDSAHMARKLFESNNMPEYLFHEIARNGELMDKIGAGDYFKRYDSLPEDEQNKKYEPILNSGSQKAAISVVRANAPQASWDRAFNMLSTDNKQRLIKDEVEHVKNHRPDIFHNAVLGMYNDPGDNDRIGGSFQNYQAKAVSHLDPESPNDRSVLDQLISVPEGQPGHMSDEGLLNNIPDEMYTKPGDDALIDHAAASGKAPLAYNLLARKMNQLSRGVHVSSYESEDKKAIGRQKAEDLVNYLHGRVASMPSFSDSETDNPIAEKWYSLMTRQKQGYHDDRFLSSLKAAGANLDFLADMPGKDGELVKHQALADNLLSPEKLQQMTQANSVRDILAIGNPKLRQRTLDSWVSGGNHTPEDLEHLAAKINSSMLNPEAHEHGRRSSMRDETLGIYNSRLNNLIDLYRTKSPGELSTMLAQALSAPAQGDDLTQDDRKRIAKSVLEHLASASYAIPEDKNGTMLSAYVALKSRNMAPANMGKQIERNAIDQKDYDTMIQLSDHGILSSEGISALARAAAQPNTLNARQIAGVSSQLNSNTEPAAVLEIAKTFENKISQEGINDPRGLVREKFMNNLASTFTPSESGPEEQQKNEFVLNYIKKQTLDPKIAPFAHAQLRNMAMQSAEAGNVDQAVSLWEQLPNDPNQLAAGAELSEDRIPDNLLNDPRFVEASASEWKLQALAENADRLTGANSSILVNRSLAVNAENPYSIDQSRMFSKMEHNQYVQPDDSVKLARSMPDEKFNPLIRQIGQAMDGNLIYAVHAKMRDMDALVKDPNLAAPNAPFMGAEHRNKILSNLDQYATAIHNASVKEETPNLKDKLGKISEMIGQIHGHIKTVASHMRLQAPDLNNTGKLEASRDHATMLSILTKIAKTGIQLDREDALKVMDMVKEYHSIEEASGKELAPEKTHEAIKGIVGAAENFEEQDWREMFKSAPHAIFALRDRTNIPTEALNGSNYQQFGEKSTNKDENRAKTAFVKSSKDWFAKMSKEDIAHHGKNLLHMYVKLKNNNEIFHNDYTYAMEEGLKYMGPDMSHKDLTDLLAQSGAHDLRNSLFQTAVENGVGGVESLRAYAKENHDYMFSGHTDIHPSEGHNLAMKLKPVTSSPHIDEDLAAQVYDMFDRNKEAMAQASIDILSNKSTPPKAVKMYTDAILRNDAQNYKDIDKRTASEMATQLMQHPNVSEQDLGELFALSNEQFPKFFAPGGKFNPALTNPTYGGKLFRAIPVALPESQKAGASGSVDESKVLRDISLQHKDYERMKATMALIPAEGMAWAEFKRKFPAEEKSLPPSVKAVFTSAQNKPVMPEQFAQAMRALDDNSKKYHLTYSEWSSKLQRHNPPGRANLVVQVNNSEASEKELSQDPKLWSLYQHLLQKTNGISNGSIGMHPTTPHMVSWSRVDTDQSVKGKNAWAIEEYQSDFAQKFRRNLKALMSQFPAGTKINGQNITAEDMKQYAKKIDTHLSDWTEASMSAVIENARAQGITHLYMHGAELRGYMSNGGKYDREYWDNPNTKPFTVGFRKIYDENPRKFGFQQCDYTDYPKHNKEMLNNLKKNKLSTKCWVLELQPKAPKKRRA